MNQAVECPKCFKALWHATGRTASNCRKLIRAECVCESCGYIFHSARPAAMEAAERARNEPRDEAGQAATSTPGPRRHGAVPARSGDFVTPSEFASRGKSTQREWERTLADYKKRQSGDGDGA